MSVQRGQCCEDSRKIFNSVSVVGHVQNIFVAGEIVPIKIQRIEWPIGVICSQDNQLWLVELVSVLIRVDDRQKLFPCAYSTPSAGEGA